MAKNEESMFAEERKRLIVDTINKKSKVTVAQLCDLFNVSPATIRNDLRELEATGLLTRTHGGAVSVNRFYTELPYNERATENSDEKKAIGKLAASLVKDNDTILIDVGTTTIEMAKNLSNINKLTVVTNDIEVARFLNENTNASVYILGGHMRSKYNSISGKVTIDMLSNLHVDKAFLSAEGVTFDNGATVSDVNLSDFKQEAMKHSNRTIVLCDSSKFSKVAFCKFADLEEIDMLITSEKFKEKDLAEIYKSKNIDILMAPLEA